MLLRKLKTFLYNLKWWWSFLWNDMQFDHSYMYAMLGRKLQRMYNFHISEGCTYFSDKDLRKLRLAYLLCKRIALEDYSPFLGDDFLVPKRWDNVIPYEDYMIKQDMDLLFKILKTQSLKWWD